MNVFWFRRDLRLNDNKGFFEALKSDEKVLPIFIFDKEILDTLANDDARVTFIHQLLLEMNGELKTKRKSLAVFYGKPVEVFGQLIKENAISNVFTNHDYEPYARERDLDIQEFLQQHNIHFHTFKDQVIFEKSEVTKDDGLPYVVYTPYSNKWKQLLGNEKIEHFPSENHFENIADHSYPFLDLKDIGFSASKIQVRPFDISKDLIENYEQTRNFPAIDRTSHLSPHLRFGSASIRKMVSKALLSTSPIYLNELIWREFFMQILWHFPDTVHKSFRPKYDAIQWRYDEDAFEKWCEGKTGYPFVDAGMRELNATGHMHNRVRLIVSSFLCKHLLIDWRWGEGYFAQKLLDYEQSSNVGNWQWAAGSGVDAAPYFRIFNPMEQIKKFDKEYQYIKKWVPEFGTDSYPAPIVDHKFARERCLQTYKKALDR